MKSSPTASFAAATYPLPPNRAGIAGNHQEGSLIIGGQPTIQIAVADPPFDLMGVVISPLGLGDFFAEVAAYFYANFGQASAARFQLIGIQGGLTINGADPAVGFYQAQPDGGNPPIQPIVLGATTRILLDTGGHLPAPTFPLVESISMAALPAFNETRSFAPVGSPPVANQNNFPVANGKVWFGLRIVSVTGTDIVFGPSPIDGPIGTIFAQEIG